MGISDRHILVPYLWIRPISSWVRFGVKNQKKVDNAVVFGLRDMHNHTHLGHVMGYVGIGDVFRWFGAFFGVRGPPEGGPRTRVLIENYTTTGVKGEHSHRVFQLKWDGNTTTLASLMHVTVHMTNIKIKQARKMCGVSVVVI